MSLLDDIRTEREREGLVEGEWLHRDRGLYAAGRWTFEPLRHPAAIKAAREAKAAALAKTQADLDHADDLMAEKVLFPDWQLIRRNDATPHREAAE
ncbi:hypothetical protein [Limimaricola cinnabarinus]|uniref:hypothetical protein n=1 Tax=Limimaricola cinnabarinus TaxID=1125964 RepID=UPI0024901953|nr:hypothetical protein [Limimaricola cinnabarinus]